MSACLPNCVIFDLDGTLLDSLTGIEYSVQAAFASCNIAQHRTRLSKMIGPPIRTILSQAGDIADSVALDALEQAFRASYDSEGWRKTICFPGANRILRIMRLQGYRLFVVSNKPRHISLQILDAEGILDFFENIITCDSRSPAYTGKVEMIRTLMSMSEVSSENCLLTGDTMEDAEAATAVGIRFAYMAHGYGEVPSGGPVSVDFSFDGFLELLPLMKKELVHD